MNDKKIHIDIEVLKLLFFKYQAYLLPVIGFVVSWLLFFQFVVPQIQNFLTVKDQVANSEQTLAILTQNYNTISLLPDSDIDTLLTTANRALPSVKDFAGILNAISTAAAVSGVTVNDYSFQLGDLSTINQPVGTTQNVQLVLTIHADVGKTQQFLTALSKQLPLSEVVSVTIAQAGTAEITTNFFFSPQITPSFVDTNPIAVVSSSQKQLLKNFVASSSASSSLSE